MRNLYSSFHKRATITVQLLLKLWWDYVSRELTYAGKCHVWEMQGSHLTFWASWLNNIVPCRARDVWLLMACLAESCGSLMLPRREGGKKGGREGERMHMRDHIYEAWVEINIQSMLLLDVYHIHPNCMVENPMQKIVILHFLLRSSFSNSPASFIVTCFLSFVPSMGFLSEALSPLLFSWFLGNYYYLKGHFFLKVFADDNFCLSGSTVVPCTLTRKAVRECL